MSFATAEGPDAPARQVLDAGLGERLIDPIAHRSRWNSDVFQPERNLTLDGVVHGLQLWVLEDKPDCAGQDSSRRHDSVQPGDFRRAGDASSVKVRDQTVQHAQQRGLPTARWPGHQRDRVRDVDAHVIERRRGAAGVPVREVAQARRRHVSTGVNKRRQAATAGAWIAGRVNDG